MPYFRTQKEKNEYKENLSKALSNLPTSIDDLDRKPIAPPKKKKKRYNPPSGYRLGDVMPQELKDKAYAYRRRLKSGKLRESNNKGDQYYGKKRSHERTAN